jgi:hypothetical protein
MNPMHGCPVCKAVVGIQQKSTVDIYQPGEFNEAGEWVEDENATIETDWDSSKPQGYFCTNCLHLFGEASNG